MNNYTGWEIYVYVSLALSALALLWMLGEDFLVLLGKRQPDHKFGPNYCSSFSWLIVAAYLPFVNFVAIAIVLISWWHVWDDHRITKRHELYGAYRASASAVCDKLHLDWRDSKLIELLDALIEGESIDPTMLPLIDHILHTNTNEAVYEVMMFIGDIKEEDRRRCYRDSTTQELQEMQLWIKRPVIAKVERQPV